jgi:hypothetical protein
MAGEQSAIAAVAGFMPEGSMRHDWIYDVLSDLRDYAVANGLPELATSVELALVAARRETAAMGLADPGDRHPALRQRRH